jgi:hypothetical protein
MRYSRNSSYPESTPPALTVVVHRTMNRSVVVHRTMNRSAMNRSPMTNRAPYKPAPS